MTGRQALAALSVAFGVVGKIISATGRRRLVYDRMARYRVVEVLTGSPMLEAAMAPRRARRAKARADKKPFRAVYGYRGATAKNHKEAIRLIKRRWLNGEV